MLFNAFSLMVVGLLAFNVHAQVTSSLYIPSLGAGDFGPGDVLQVSPLGTSAGKTSYEVKFIPQETEAQGEGIFPTATLIQGPSDVLLTYHFTSSADVSVTNLATFDGALTCNINNGQSSCSQTLEVGEDASTVTQTSAFTEAVTSIPVVLVGGSGSPSGTVSNSGTGGSGAPGPQETGTGNKTNTGNSGMRESVVSSTVIFAVVIATFGRYLF